jgi:hypothetical protein
VTEVVPCCDGGNPEVDINNRVPLCHFNECFNTNAQLPSDTLAAPARPLSATQMLSIITCALIYFCILTSMASPSLPATAFDTQTKRDSLLLDLETWNATLHFVGVEDKGTDSVDLFELTQPNKYRAAGLYQSPSPIIFNRNTYPPTTKGLKTHKFELITQALSEGTHLTCNNQKYQLDCFHCKHYCQKKGKKATTNLQSHHISDSVSEHSDDATSDVNNDMHSIIDSYDTFGVKFGICRYQYLQDWYAQRPDGHSDVKGTTTQCPTDPSECCYIKLVLKFHEFGDLDHGYIHLSCGFGSWLHKFHVKPDPGDLYQHKRHWVFSRMHVEEPDSCWTQARSI